MNAARRRLEAAKKRNAERDAQQKQSRNHNTETHVELWICPKEPKDALSAQFMVPRDKVVSTVREIMEKGVWVRRSKVVNFYPPDNIAVVEIDIDETT